MPKIRTITPFLWFDDQAEEAGRFYTSIFDESRIVNVARYTEAGREVHGKPAGTAMTVDFELRGQPFTALNGGPQFKFNEAVSFQVPCETQEELDRIWERLSEGGDKNAQRCGWLKDKYGVSWQVVPAALPELMKGTPEQSQRVMQALLAMRKLNIQKLKQAYEGKSAAVSSSAT